MCGERKVETYIIICEIDSQRELVVCLREPKQRLCINQGGGMGREVGGRFKRERGHNVH